MHRMSLMLALWLATEAAFAATPRAIMGGSGLGYMRTADIMSADEAAIYYSARLDSYPAAGGGDAALTERLVGFANSHTGTSEFDLSVRHGSFNPPAGTGETEDALRGIKAVFKQRLGGPTAPSATGTGAALTLHTRFLTNDAAPVTSERETAGVELNLSRWSMGSALHFNTGYAYDETWSTTLDRFVNDHVFTVELGMEKALSADMTFAAQALSALRRDTEDNGMVASLVLGYEPSPATTTSLALAWGHPSDRADFGASVLFNITYTGSSGRSRSLLPESPSLRDVQHQNDRLLERTGKLSARFDDLEQALAAKAASEPKQPTDNGIAVEVVNASGIGGLGAEVATALRGLGYRIVSVTPSQVPLRQTTRIFYAQGHDRQAVSLGHRLPGNQLVFRDALPEGVVLRVVVGSDQQR